MDKTIPRKEYPRPEFAREDWLNLNGIWDFAFDDREVGEREEWFKNKEFEQEIMVPFTYQSEKSGINNQDLHEVIWYRRVFDLPQSFIGKRVLLNFGAVDYFTKVWINGKYLGSHKGGYLPFKFDITIFTEQESNTIVVRVEDRSDTVQPRGKQYWEKKPDRCWYVASSGIWQTVWLETVGEISFDKVRITPDIDNCSVRSEIYLDSDPVDVRVKMELSYNGKAIRTSEFDLNNRITKYTIDIKEEDEIDEIHYWTPENPNLYDLKLTLLKDGQIQDVVKTYYGMRKISVKGDQILLNNRPLYQKLILDQGYWQDTLLTPPSDEAIKYDIEMTKKMGFNGARKHQKIEDPRYYYWADKIGLLVWGEMPSAYSYNYEERKNLTTEYQEFINRDYNHPSIITWVPLNESWGVRNIVTDPSQQDFARMLYYLSKAEDQSRLVSTNDGWEQVLSDINAIHDYAAEGETLTEKYIDPEKVFAASANNWRMLYAEGEEYQGEPVLMTEYGGIAFTANTEDENWGYGYGVEDEDEFFKRYEGLLKALNDIPYIRGYCYTQLTDVMQEVNGIMTMDRKMKVDIDRVKRANT